MGRQDCLTYVGKGKAKLSTRSTEPFGPFVFILSSKSSAVFWMYGRMLSTCLGVKYDSTMPLVRLDPTSGDAKAVDLPVSHVLRGVHVNKCRSAFGG